MSDQSPNLQFHASRFIKGHNLEFAVHLRTSCANRVNGAWQAVFAGRGKAVMEAIG